MTTEADKINRIQQRLEVLIQAMQTLATAVSYTHLKSSDVGGRPYVSGLLQTHLSFSQRYGYFEITAKMSAAKGTMSAFWLLPASGAWPPEIDVVEVLANHPTLLATSAHTGPDTVSYTHLDVYKRQLSKSRRP